MEGSFATDTIPATEAATDTIPATEAATDATEATVAVPAKSRAKRGKKKTESSRNIKKGVKRPLRRVEDGVLRARRAVFKQREEAHIAVAARAAKLVQQYDAEFMHRGITVDTEVAA